MYSSMHAFKLCTRKSIAVSHTTRSYISTLRLHKTLVCWWNTEFDFWYKRHLLHIALVYDISDTGTRLRVLSFREKYRTLLLYITGKIIGFPEFPKMWRGTFLKRLEQDAQRHWQRSHLVTWSFQKLMPAGWYTMLLRIAICENTIKISRKLGSCYRRTYIGLYRKAREVLRYF